MGRKRREVKGTVPSEPHVNHTLNNISWLRASKSQTAGSSIIITNKQLQSGQQSGSSYHFRYGKLSKLPAAKYPGCRSASLLTIYRTPCMFVSFLFQSLHLSTIQQQEINENNRRKLGREKKNVNFIRYR